MECRELDIKQEKQQRTEGHRDRSRSPHGNAGQRSNGGSDQRDRKARTDKFGRLPSTRQVCVANVPYSMTWQEVKDLFRDKVGDVSYVRLFEEECGRSKGCGIVEFAQPGGVKKALDEMHRFEINGRRLVVKEDYEVERDRHGKPVSSKSRNDRPLPALRKGRSPDKYDDRHSHWDRNERDFQERFDTYGFSEEFLDSLNITGPLINRVFVANIDYNVGERKLKEVFKMAGKIENIDFMKDKDGKSRGRAVIEYEHPLEAVQAISMLNKQKLFDRILSVEMDKFKTSDENRTFNVLPSGLGGIGRGLGMNGEPVNVGSTGDNRPFGHPTNPIEGLGSSNLLGNQSLGLGGGLNMPNPAGHGGSMHSNLHPALSNLSQQQLLALVSSGLLSGSSANIGPNMPASNSMAMGSSMNFSGSSGGLRNEPSSLLNNSSGIAGLSGVGPTLSFNSKQSPSRNYDLPGPGSRYSEDGDRRYGRNDPGMFGDVNRSDTVSVRNLPHHFTWENLRQKFNDIGDVIFAEIRNRGSGVIRFSSVRDAERAVNLMNGTRVEGRPIEVQLYDFVR